MLTNKSKSVWHIWCVALKSARTVSESGKDAIKGFESSQYLVFIFLSFKKIIFNFDCLDLSNVVQGKTVQQHI